MWRQILLHTKNKGVPNDWRNRNRLKAERDVPCEVFLGEEEAPPGK